MDRKWHTVLEQFKRLDSAVIAFSGGMDSTLLLAAAAQVQAKVLAVTARGDIFSSLELARAEQTAQELGIPHMFFDFEILHDSEFIANGADRCYLCKKALIAILKYIADKKEFVHIIDGTNADDVHDYRPGLKALSEEGVLSPLKEAGLTKGEVLLMAERLNLPVIPSNACLASRVPFGHLITSRKLKQIEEAEQMLLSLGFSQCRVRHHGEIARIELPESGFRKILSAEMREKIIVFLESLGFDYISLDLLGYVTGSMNKSLKKGDLRCGKQV